MKGCLTVLDATVAEEICGIALKRRDHYFFFDREAYRRWNGSVVVWLEPAPPGGDGTGGDGGEQPPTNGGGGVGGMAAILQQHGGTCRHDKTGVFQPNGTDLRENRETLLQEKRILRKNETPQHLDVSHTDAGSGGCALADSSSKIASDAILAGEVEQSNILARYDGGTSHSLLHPAVHAANVGASRVCDTEHVSGIIPLPGLLTPNEFFRTAKDMGNCSVCGEGRIAWWSEKERTGICERCYTRFLREENWGKGVG
ncbi:hypothetical protein MKMG_02179 [Methanogenium sp. MK-MG]|nr:hypothetical protein MKMG_02179 [Methanogenium sp. MK-MG]